MKKLLIILTSLMLVSTMYSQSDQPIEALIDAMIHVESNDNPNAIGDGGKAVGVLQIWKIMVDDVNRILRLYDVDHSFTYDDRYDREQSIGMFFVWLWHYFPNYTSADYQEIARAWNGGRSGRWSHSTRYYWYKVSNALEVISVVYYNN
tara:strand:- start:102 stop:548 length:447 start_codon:yes stop_codon:yes gene_type:complete